MLNISLIFVPDNQANQWWPEVALDACGLTMAHAHRPWQTPIVSERIGEKLGWT